MVDSSDSESDASSVRYDGDETSSHPGKAPRKRKKGMNKRREELEKDEWIKNAEEKRVRCKGCNNWVTLQGNRKYDTKNWLSHRKRCSQITGVKLQRLSFAKAKMHEPLSNKKLSETTN